MHFTCALTCCVYAYAYVRVPTCIRICIRMPVISMCDGLFLKDWVGCGEGEGREVDIADMERGKI